MRKLSLIILLVCACNFTLAQTNFVKNPGFEDYYACPDEINQIGHAKSWTCAVDTIGEPYYAPECFNICAIATRVSIPNNLVGFQNPHSGAAYVGGTFYYNKTLPAPPSVPFDFRDYFQGHLHKPLIAGKTYCVSYWVVMAEVSGYAHNKIGAYLDNGAINKMGGVPGEEITSVVPQISSTTKISDTVNWTKIEGSFIATGNETHITFGNFSKNSSTDTSSVPYYATFQQYSYYLFDDISVVPIDLPADAGKDSHAELGKNVQIGRVGDTTAQGLDCKWYKKGVLIDSGAIISVNAGATVGAIDTYVVVQTICGLVKTDTVTVKTVPVGIPLPGGVRGGFSVYPNPSSGVITLEASTPLSQTSTWVKVYDLLGRVVYQKELSFVNNESAINLNVADGVYILELFDSEGNSSRQRVEIRN